MNDPAPILRSIPELEPNIPAETFTESSLWVTTGISAAIALVIFGLGLFIWWRHRRRKLPSAPSQTDIALAAIDKLEAERPGLRAASLRLSLILRAFLSGQTQDPALYETHEEFSHRMDSLASVPASCQYETRCLLESLAEQKYAGELQEDAALTHHFMAQCRELVKRIAEAQAAARAEAQADENPRP